MANRIPVARRRLRKSSGNVMIETMLVLLPTFAIISGFFDVTFALFDWSVLQNAARAGVRFAVTYQTIGGQGQNASIGQTVMNNSFGLLPNTNLVVTNYYTQQNPNTVITGSGGNLPGNIVEVSIQGYNLQWMVPIAGTVINPFRNQAPATISLYARDVLGGYPVGQTSVTE
jgi:Flp pilus assembly protein TadG